MMENEAMSAFKERNTVKLPEAVAKQFEATKGASRTFVFGSHGKVDLNTVNLERAASLAKDGCPYLVQKSSTSVKKEKENH